MATKSSPQISIRVSPEFRALVDAVHLQRRETTSTFVRDCYTAEAADQIDHAMKTGVITNADRETVFDRHRGRDIHSQELLNVARADLLNFIYCKRAERHAGMCDRLEGGGQ